MEEERTRSGIRLENRLPTPEEHRRIAIGVGWEHGFNWPALPDSLEASLAGVVALDGDIAIGMGRLVGDNAMYFYIQDVAIDPGYQRMGIGQEIVERLLQHVRDVATGPAFVGLFATDAAMGLYQRNGFTRGDMTGLFQVLSPAPEEEEDE